MFEVSQYSVTDAEKYNSFCTLKFGPHFGVRACLMIVGCEGNVSVILGGVYKGRSSSKGKGRIRAVDRYYYNFAFLNIAP